MSDLLATLQRAGFKGAALKTAWAVAMRESGGDPTAYNPDRTTGDDSHGLFQINMLGPLAADRDAKFRQHVKGYTGIESLKDPDVNARATYYMTNKGTDWKQWDIDASGYNGGTHAAKYREWLSKFPGDGGDVSATGTMGSLPRSAQQAIQWATTSAPTQKNAYNGLCDHFVAAAYGLPNSGYASARAHWDALKGNQHADNQPPVGALVYWDTGSPAGHVAVVTGKDAQGNALVTTTHLNNGTPTVVRLNQVGFKYLGWTPPIFQNRTAPIDKTGTGIVQPSQVQTKGKIQDSSGIDIRTAQQIQQSAVGVGASNNGVPERDKLSKEQLQTEYGFAENLLYAVPELGTLFEKAASEDWAPAQIDAEIKSSQWFHDHSSYARETLMASAVGGEDWRIRKENAAQVVDSTVTTIGAELDPTQREAIITRLMAEGWDKRVGGVDMLKKAIAEKDSIKVRDTGQVGSGFMSGDSGTLQQDLMAIGEQNGLKLSKGYYESAAKSIEMGAKTKEDYERDIRSQAASLWPTFKDKILAGHNMTDLASGYLSSYERVMEKPRETLDIMNPDVRKALTMVDDKGNAAPMGLYDFETMLRKKPEWMNTKQAQDKTASLASQIAQIFGFTG